jgi:hypothetical protein
VEKAYLFRQLHASPASRTDYPTGAQTHSGGAAKLDEYLEQMRSGLSTLNPRPPADWRVRFAAAVTGDTVRRGLLTQQAG